MVRCPASSQLSVSKFAPQLFSSFSPVSLPLELVPSSRFPYVRVDWVLVIVVVTRIVVPRSEWSSNSSSLPFSLLRRCPSRDAFMYPSLDAFLGYAPLRVVDPKSLDRERNATKRGRIFAIDDAVMPMPGSTVDQMDTSVLAHRKSSVCVN